MANALQQVIVRAIHKGHINFLRTFSVCRRLPAARLVRMKRSEVSMKRGAGSHSLNRMGRLYFLLGISSEVGNQVAQLLGIKTQ